MACEKCTKKVDSYKVHDRNDNDKVKWLCPDCAGNPEYFQECPHCDAIICVN